MPPKPPIVWHLDTEEIDDQFGSPPDRLTVIKWIMQLYEVDAIKRKEAFKAFEKVCKNKDTDENIRLLIKKVKINADSSRIEEILAHLGIVKGD